MGARDFSSTGGGAAVGNPSMVPVKKPAFMPVAPEAYKIAPSVPTPNWGPAEEQGFQEGVRQTPWYSEFKDRFGEGPDLDSKEYNYRAAWAAGARPAYYEPDKSHHWPGETANGQSLKAKDHPTGWMEDYYQMTGGLDPTDAVPLNPAQVSRMQALLKQRYAK